MCDPMSGRERPEETFSVKLAFVEPLRHGAKLFGFVLLALLHGLIRQHNGPLDRQVLFDPRRHVFPLCHVLHPRLLDTVVPTFWMLSNTLMTVRLSVCVASSVIPTEM